MRLANIECTRLLIGLNVIVDGHDDKVGTKTHGDFICIMWEFKHHMRDVSQGDSDNEDKNFKVGPYRDFLEVAVLKELFNLTRKEIKSDSDAIRI